MADQDWQDERHGWRGMSRRGYVSERDAWAPVDGPQYGGRGGRKEVRLGYGPYARRESGMIGCAAKRAGRESEDRSGNQHDYYGGQGGYGPDYADDRPGYIGRERRYHDEDCRWMDRVGDEVAEYRRRMDRRRDEAHGYQHNYDNERSHYQRPRRWRQDW